MTFDTLNYTENMQILLKAAEFDTWTHIRIKDPYLTPRTTAYMRKTLFDILNP